MENPKVIDLAIMARHNLVIDAKDIRVSYERSDNHEPIIGSHRLAILEPDGGKAMTICRSEYGNEIGRVYALDPFSVKAERPYIQMSDGTNIHFRYLRQDDFAYNGQLCCRTEEAQVCDKILAAGSIAEDNTDSVVIPIQDVTRIAGILYDTELKKAGQNFERQANERKNAKRLETSYNVLFNGQEVPNDKPALQPVKPGEPPKKLGRVKGALAKLKDYINRVGSGE